MRYGDLTYIEIRELADAGSLALVPVGSIEQHGLHLPVDLGAWLAEAVCLAASRRAQKRHQVVSLVLPTLPFGPALNHREPGSGSVALPAPVHEAVLWAILESLVEQGFRRIVVWRACGSCDLETMSARFAHVHAGRSLVLLPARPLQATWGDVGSDTCSPCGQPDAFATSVALYLRPEAVRSALIREADCAAGWESADTIASAAPTQEASGAHASAELGKRLWESLVEELCARLAEATEPEP